MRKRASIRSSSLRAQSGAVLIVSLLFLVVLTMLGVTAMTSSTFEERMAGNARDAAIAQHAAEAALRVARNLIIEISGARPAAGNFNKTISSGLGECVAGLCTPRVFTGTVPPEIPDGVKWNETALSGSTTLAYASDTAADRLKSVSKQSRYIIELFCFPVALTSIGGVADSCRYWRFTAVGWGKNPNTQVTVQEFYLSDR
jgi:type IV pilus assembly protein PilX